MKNYENRIPFAISIASKMINDSYNNVVMRHGITRSQSITLYYIGRFEPISQKELARKMNIKESTMTGILDRLEKEGYIERSIDSGDLRKKTLSLSGLGQAKIEEVCEVTRDFHSAADSFVSEEEEENIIKVIENIVSAIRAWESSLERS
ncbi:MAG: MarR family transcriptional regulator [Anaerococcus sp.]|nr:MarR family transcriptional regulator [Anaerococcus sp.]